MPFVKLDSKTLMSTIWRDDTAFKIFMAALLSAEPAELPEQPTYRPFALETTGWLLPAGWYGFAAVSGPWLVDQVNVDQRDGAAALERLCSTEETTRSDNFGGRRLARIDGGYVVLNYMKYREFDHSSAERTRLWRKRKKEKERDVTVTSPRHGDVTNVTSVTEAEADTEMVHGSRKVHPRESDSIPAAPPRVLSWSKEACDDWISRFEGTAPGGPIGKHLKPLVDRHGWEVVRPAWQAYLLSTEPEFANPARFAATFGTWKKAIPVARKPPEPVPPGDPEAYQFFEAMKIRLSGVLSRESMVTWFRPTYGRCWEGQTLVLTVPTEQFAQQMRYYAERLRQAAGELGKDGVTFRTIVLPTDPALEGPHNGSIR